MSRENFIPKDITDLYEKLKEENLKGELSKENDLLIWKLPNHIVLKIAINIISDRLHEGYIDTYYLKNGREQNLTHWHPADDEIYEDLMNINEDRIIWVKKKTIWGEWIMIMDKKEYEAMSDKRKSKYSVL